MPARSLKARTVRNAFIIGFPLVMALILLFGAFVLLEDEEARERSKEATGIDFNESAAQMIALLAISFAILCVAFILIVKGLMRTQRK